MMLRITFLMVLCFTPVNQEVLGQQVVFNTSDYQVQQGIDLSIVDSTATVTWDGQNNHEFLLRFNVVGGMPTFETLSVRSTKGAWKNIASYFQPVFNVVSGLRRVTQQQTEPLEKLGIPLTAELIDSIKWDAFWDAPLYLSKEPPTKRQHSIPASQPFASHPGMPRKQAEVTRASAEFNVHQVRFITNGTRLEIVFDHVQVGVFSGYLQLDIIKNENLVRMMLVAKTDDQSIAFKYDAGLTGLPVSQTKQILSRDIDENWVAHELDIDDGLQIRKTANRLIAASFQNGSLACFPAPHSFYWARETEEVLGYNWYQMEDSKSFSIGIRQAELEENPEYHMNFALYNARPGKWQKMPMFIYLHSGTGKQVINQALEFTRGDRYKKIEGYKTMGHHYHVGLVDRTHAESADNLINDIQSMKKVGVDIYGVIDGVRDPAGRHDKGEAYLNGLKMYYDAARSQSDKQFLVMPCDENSTRGRRPFLGGHYDIIPSKPIYWRPQRDEGQPLVEEHPIYKTVYNVGTPSDMLQMAEMENVLIAMPHPNSKGSTGYPQSIKDAPHIHHPNYFGLGYRWGMGIDASETRLGEYRFLNLWDLVNNDLVKRGFKPKYAIAISETRSDKGSRGKPSSDDIYGMSPVNYLKLDRVPSIDDMSSIVEALKAGNYFITTGEVLITDHRIAIDQGQPKFVADIEWTFPLDFVELVWGDGNRIGREIIKATHLPAFSQKRFELPFDPSGKKWIRLAVWDIAGNGALVNPMNLKQSDFQ